MLDERLNIHNWPAGAKPTSLRHCGARTIARSDSLSERYPAPAYGQMPPLFAISSNPGIHNKPPAWREEFARNWQQHEVDPEGLLYLIRSGTAWIPAAMTSPHRSSSAFAHADLAVVDIDHGTDLDGFLAGDLAASALLYYTTANHKSESGSHRFRVVFRLPHRISDPDLYKAIVQQLIRSLGGDPNASDPCRIFYSYSCGTQELLHPEATLPESFITAAQQKLRDDLKRRREATDEVDPTSLAQAEWVLEHVLKPTADGQRDLFVRITAAAASAGDALYGAWSDWASRGHHGTGKNRKQTSERFFRGFSGRSTLATLFFLAKEQDPDWRKQLPDHLRGESIDMGIPGVVGYSHQDFLGDRDFDPDNVPPRDPTPSIFQWAEDYCATRAPKPIDEASTDPDEPSMPTPPAFLDDEPVEIPDEDGFETIFAGEISPDPITPPPKRGRGRPPKNPNKNEGLVAEILFDVRRMYPGLRLNVLTQALEYDSKDGVKELQDPTTAYLLLSRHRKRDVYPKTMVADIIYVEAERNQYNPVVTYLDSCASTEPVPYWDTIAEELLGVGFDENDNPRLRSGHTLANVILQRFLIGAVARAMKPGCRHDWMLVLIGNQNKGKSWFFQYLTPPDLLNNYPWSATVQQGISYIKDRPHILHAGWIVLLDECDRFFERRYVEELKNLVSVATDRSAPKYRNEKNYPRSFVLAGNTNSDSFMLDPTGNRRFLPIRVLGKVLAPRAESNLIIDLDKVKTDRNGIWAAARKAYLDGEPHDFSSDEISQIEGYLSTFMVDDPMLEAVATVLQLHPSNFFEGRPIFFMKDICKRLEIPERDFSRVRLSLADVLRRLGLKKTRRRITRGGRAQDFWIYDNSRLLTEAQLPQEGKMPADW